MIASVRQRRSGSWLDPESSPFLASALSRRLEARLLNVKRAMFLTLTYRRDEYEDALDLYRKTSERQDVPMFFRALTRLLARSFTGRWFCKMEFQQGGWVHFHVLIVGEHFLSHETLTQAWRHGYVWVERYEPRHVSYLSKYVAKNGEVPAWALMEKPRSFKVVRCSPGFWGDGGRPSSPPSERVRLPMYVPIGIRIQQSRRTTIVRIEYTDELHEHFSVPLPLSDVLDVLQCHRVNVVDSPGSWLDLDAFDFTELRRILRDLTSREHAAAAAERRRGVHLIQASNPDRKLFEAAMFSALKLDCPEVSELAAGGW